MRKLIRSQQMNNNMIVMIAGVVVALCIALALLITPIVKASSSNNIPKDLQVKSIQIQHGDTLWSIASEYYSNEYTSLATYIDEIKKCNNISSDTIHAGNYLLVPYYK